MTKSFRQQHTLSLREAPVLAFDVDWSRGRVVAIVDGSDEIAQASVVGGRLQTMEGFGERHAEPDGRGANAVAIHPGDAAIATSGWHRRVRVWGLDPDMTNCRELGDRSAKPG
jgi:hypothetical protein